MKADGVSGILASGRGRRVRRGRVRETLQSGLEKLKEGRGQSGLTLKKLAELNFPAKPANIVMT